MSVVIAVAHEKGVTIGSDGRVILDSDILTDYQHKWSRSGDLWIGTSGFPDVAPDLGRLAEAHPEPSKLCAAFRAWLREEGWAPSGEDGRPPRWNLNLLLTDGVRLWEVSGALYPAEVALHRLAGIGSGYQYALGAWTALDRPKYSVRQRVVAAIEAAIAHDAHCGGVVFVEKVRAS